MNDRRRARPGAGAAISARPGGGRNRLGAGKMPCGSGHVHRAEPADLALAKARQFAGGLPDGGYCDECGRRLAIASVQWSDWVVRRVEKVRFRDDRSVNRQISIDLLV